MARKKVEPIESLGKDTDKLLVQKSRPLFALWRSELTLSEFKILDTYLSRINSKNPEKRAVIFSKGELEKILGVKRIRKNDLDERLKHLMTTVKIEDSTSKRGFTRIALFEKAQAEQDDEGLWQVEMTCTQSAMKYIFNIENLGYLRYKLRCITSLKSRQAYVMFMFLEANRFRTPFVVELEELKQVLSCENEETYKEYKRFNDRVLKRIQKELNEKTECKFTYESIKKGRSVVAIRFHLETLKELIKQDNDQIEGQMTLDDIVQDQEDKNAIYACVLPETFTPEQVELIRKAAVKKVPYYNDGPLPYECLVADYIDYKVKLMYEHEKRTNKVKNDKFSYLRKMIENDK